MRKLNTRKPYYSDDADYKTNAPSYYDDLARKQILIEELSKRIWDYEKTLDENLQMLKDKLKEIENIIGEGFDLRIEELLREWVDDGTLDHIINEEIFNQKADKDWVEEELEKELNKTTYYDGYNVTSNHDPVSSTDYWLTEINTDDETPLFFDVTEGAEGETVREYAIKHETTISINGSTMEESNGVITPSGVTIINGETITDKVSSFQWKVGLDNNNKLHYFRPEETADEIKIKQPNIVHVLTAFTPIIIDGEAASESILNDGINYDETHPRQVIGQKENGNVIFLTTGGRGYGGVGMKLDDCIRILQNTGCEFAFMLDGGGSTSLVEKGIFINNRIDALGTRERKRPTTINLGTKDSRPYMNDIRELFSKISDVESRLYTFESPEFVSNVNNISKGGFYWALRDTEGVPNDDENSWAIIHFQLGRDAMQIAFPYRTAISLQGYLFIRRVYGSTFTDWRNTSDVRRIPDLEMDTPYSEIPIGHYHNWASGWYIDGENKNGFVITENAYAYGYGSCIQTFYEHNSYNIYYRKPNDPDNPNLEPWSRFVKIEGTPIER